MLHNKRQHGSRAVGHRRGQALVEFAIISLVMVTILAGTLGLGIMLMRANIGVVAANSVSNLLDLEFDHDAIDIHDSVDDGDELQDLLADSSRVESGPNYYSETDLVLTPTQYKNARDDFDNSGVSLVIRSMLPLYQYDQPRNVYHFPGTIVKRVSDEKLTVLVPMTNGRDASHRQIISQWRKPLELSYLPEDEASGIPAKATVSLNFPTSSGVLIAYRDTGEYTPGGDAVRSPISAKISPDSLRLNAVFDGAYTIQTAEEYGFDSAYAYLTEVRIFRRVFTQHSTFRFRVPALPEE